MITLIIDFITQKYDMGYCNDYIFSGHSAIFILLTLLISYYQLIPPIYINILSIITGIITFFIIISRNHYTIDIILAYLITICVFTKNFLGLFS